MVRFIKLPTHTANLRINTAISLTISIRGGDIIIDDGSFELMEIASALNLRAISTHEPTTRTFAIAQKCVQCPASDSIARDIYRTAKALLIVALSYDIDDSHIAIGTILSRRSSNNLDILDIGSGNLSQSLRTFQHTLLTIDIDQEARTTSERQVAIGIDSNRWSRLQHIDCSTT